MAAKTIINRLAVFVLALVPLAVVGAGSPNDLVTGAMDELVVALDGRKDELKADREALYAVIDEILLPRFDRKYAAQLVLGQHWRSADADQRQRFIDAFYGAMLGKYADGVLEFEQDRVEVLPFRGDATKKRTIVRTIVRLNDGQKVPVNYGVVLRDSGWMMFDVTIEGVSYIRNFRAELDSEIRSSSLDAVITRFESEAGGSASSASSE
ncbi:MAG: ABC transporter substrate-binding protein [Pseudomonadota bacterium]